MENDADTVVYRSHVRIERVGGAFRRAWLPARDEAVELVVHGVVAEHYGVQDEIERPTTLGGALEARGISASDGRLESEADGKVEKEDGGLVIQRIHVRYRLAMPADQRETAERVHEMHANACPVYRSLSGCIDITTELEVRQP